MPSDRQNITETAHILIVEDDPFVREALQIYLEGEGFTVTAAENGQQMRARLEKIQPDLAIMDLRLPGEDGFQLTRYLRETLDIGIIILTTRSDTIDRVVGLEVGADDYVTKPYEARELLARIRSLLRRLDRRGQEEAPGHHSGTTQTVNFAGWSLDRDRRQLTSPTGEITELTTGECKLLSVLSGNPRAPISRETLMKAVYNRDWHPDDRSIDVLVTKLRSKMETDRQKPRLIMTIRGVGYALAADVDIAGKATEDRPGN